jgi:integrase/recombinase XerD
MSKYRFMSIISPIIKRYLSLKEALGRKYTSERIILTKLDIFLAGAGMDLTVESFAQWTSKYYHLASGVRRNWMRVTRNLCLYRRRTDPNCFVPDLTQFPPLHQSVRPHIFTEDQINLLFSAINALKPNNRSPLLHKTYRLALVLLYTTGLRRGELMRLIVGDYNKKEQTLLIRESKFHKSRVLPLSKDGAYEIDSHLSFRRAYRFPVANDTPLLWNNYGNGGTYSVTAVGTIFRGLFRSTAIHTAAGGIPRLHDFRHSFAVNALLRWYRCGDDIQTRLPMLSLYMGHVSIISTQYYLHFIEEIASSASNIFERHCGAIVTPSVKQGGQL